MNLKNKVFMVAAATALSLSVAAPVMAQPAQTNDEGPDNVQVTVSVQDTGTFDVFFSNASMPLGQVLLDANTPETTVNGSFRINYMDTKAYRTNFNVQVSATDFTGVTNSGTNVIPASGFTIDRTYNVAQGYWGGPTSSNQSTIEYGDIGYFVNNVYPSSQAPSTQWTASNSLNSNPTVHFGYEGVGTSWAYGDVDVKLKVPVGTASDNYVSNMTLSVIAGTQP